MYIHEAIALEPGYKSVLMDYKDVAFRHYKDVLHRVSGNDWAQNETISARPIPEPYLELLAQKVVKKLEFVYKKVPVNCTTIPEYMVTARFFPNPCERMLLTW
ncbi:hypothetical protein CAEBREN_02903 [Caenorhabditis brenneri]|uniref:Uncharacterized protein n=1 Tax=Caenorhabditis brenneri TaxID=135651 RepID=G0P1Y5_CAEBE|nr:hypothetical protein CAEBREN_02903 [Caenorhabditis brenneri]